MPQEELHVQLACVLLDRPGGEGVAKAVGMDLRDPTLATEPSQELLQAVGAERDAGLQDMEMRGGKEEWTVVFTSEGQVTTDGFLAACGERDGALFVALTVEHPQSTGGEVEVFDVELDQLGAADAGIEQRKENRPVPCAGGSGFATGEQLGDVVCREGLHDSLREAYVPE